MDDLSATLPFYMFNDFKPTCATLLKTQSGQDLLEFGMCAEFWQLDVHSTAKTGTQVRGAGQDVTKMLVPHETVVVLLEDILNLQYTRRGQAFGCLSLHYMTKN